MTVRDLLPYQQQIIAEIGLSTGFHPVNRELVTFLQQSMAAAQVRSEKALARSQARSAAIRSGTRAAIGALPAGDRGVAGAVQRRILRKGPATYGLRRVPDVETVRSVLAEMLAEKLKAGSSD